MSKNILVFCDGTGQAGGLKPDQVLSNIYKLYRATRTGPDSPIDPCDQLAFYDPGLGTDADSSSVPFHFLRTIRKIYSGATGTGISSNIVECYEAILARYDPGDRIYLFGFSRGAYTARCIAGVLNLCGIPEQDGRGERLPRSGRRLRAIANEAVRKVYEHGAGRDRGLYEAEREEKAKRFRVKYGAGSAEESNAAPYFIGVFDTVAALGAKGLRRLLLFTALATIFWGLPTLLIYAAAGAIAAASYTIGLALVLVVQVFKAQFKSIRHFPDKGHFRWHFAGWRSGFYDRFLDPRVRYARHALAIDERRADFARVAWGTGGHVGPPRDSDEPEWFQQIWFAGCHSDIGGGYREEESRLSDVALQWMVEQICSLKHPVHLDKNKLHLFPSAIGVQHCEVERLLDSYPSWWPERFRFGWSESTRREAEGAPVHASVLERLDAIDVQRCDRREPYRPAALREDDRFEKYFSTKEEKNWDGGS